MDTFTLSNPSLMSRNRVVTLRPGHCSFLTLYTRYNNASKEQRAGRESHWFWWSHLRELAASERPEAIILSRILETGWRRTMTLKEDGES